MIHNVSFYTNVYNPFFELPSKKRIVHPLKNIPIEGVFELIKSKAFLPELNLYKFGKIQKNELPCFQPSGTFHFRSADQLNTYNGLICLDFDNVTNPHELKFYLINRMHFTYFVFVSPSNKGVKCFVKTNGLAKDHAATFKVVKDYYERETTFNIDKSGSDIGRLCFVSSDINAAYGPRNIFKVAKETKIEAIKTVDLSSEIDYIKKFTENRIIYKKGNINNFIFLFGCNCSRYGIDQQAAIDAALQINISTDDVQREAIVTNEIKRAYVRSSHEFGKFKINLK